MDSTHVQSLTGDLMPVDHFTHNNMIHFGRNSTQNTDASMASLSLNLDRLNGPANLVGSKREISPMFAAHPDVNLFDAAWNRITTTPPLVQECLLASVTPSKTAAGKRIEDPLAHQVCLPRHISIKLHNLSGRFFLRVISLDGDGEESRLLDDQLQEMYGGAEGNDEKEERLFYVDGQEFEGVCNRMLQDIEFKRWKDVELRSVTCNNNTSNGNKVVPSVARGIYEVVPIAFLNARAKELRKKNAKDNNTPSSTNSILCVDDLLPSQPSCTSWVKVNPAVQEDAKDQAEPKNPTDILLQQNMNVENDKRQDQQEELWDYVGHWFSCRFLPTVRAKLTLYFDDLDVCDGDEEGAGDEAEDGEDHKGEKKKDTFFRDRMNCTGIVPSKLPKERVVRGLNTDVTLGTRSYLKHLNPVVEMVEVSYDNKEEEEEERPTFVVRRVTPVSRSSSAIVAHRKWHVLSLLLAYTYVLICRRGSPPPSLPTETNKVTTEKQHCKQHVELHSDRLTLEEVKEVLDEHVFCDDPELRDIIHSVASSFRRTAATPVSDQSYQEYIAAQEIYNVVFDFVSWYRGLESDHSEPCAWNAYDVQHSSVSGVGEEGACIDSVPYLDDVLPPPSKNCKEDLGYAYHPTAKPPIPQIAPGISKTTLRKDATMTCGDDARNADNDHYALYMNTLDGRLRLFPLEIAFTKVGMLSEFIEVGRPSVPLRNTSAKLTRYLLDSVDGGSVDMQDVLSAHRFLSALVRATCGGEGEDTDPLTNWTPAQEQLHYTREYVEHHIDPDGDMPAQCAVQRVLDYVVSRHSRPDTVSAVQVSRDLVELGVKKIRRTKGIFYGLSSSEQKKWNAVTSGKL